MSWHGVTQIHFCEEGVGGCFHQTSVLESVTKSFNDTLFKRIDWPRESDSKTTFRISFRHLIGKRGLENPHDYGLRNVLG